MLISELIAFLKKAKTALGDVPVSCEADAGLRDPMCDESDLRQPQISIDPPKATAGIWRVLTDGECIALCSDPGEAERLSRKYMKANTKAYLVI